MNSVVSASFYRPFTSSPVGGCSDTTAKVMLVFGACLALALVVLVGITDVKEDRIVLREPSDAASSMGELTDLLRAVLEH